MPASLVGPDYSRITEKGILGVFYQELEDQLDAGWASMLGMEVASNQETETYRWLGMTPHMREWVGSRRAKGLRVEEYKLTNKVYESTLEIPLDDLRRDKFGALQIRIADLARRAGADHWEKLISELILANGTCYDGQSFFSSSHVSGDSGTLTNDLTSTEVPALNVTTPSAPTRDEMVDAIIGVIQHAYTLKDDQGEPMNGNARGWLVMVPPNMYGPAVGAISDRLINSGSSNSLLNQRFQVEAVANARLTSNTQLYVFRTDARAKPFILQSELPVTASVIGAGSEEEFKNRRWLFGCEAIRAAGYGLWQHAMRATLS